MVAHGFRGVDEHAFGDLDDHRARPQARPRDEAVEIGGQAVGRCELNGGDIDADLELRIE